MSRASGALRLNYNTYRSVVVSGCERLNMHFPFFLCVLRTGSGHTVGELRVLGSVQNSGLKVGSAYYTLHARNRVLGEFYFCFVLFHVFPTPCCAFSLSLALSCFHLFILTSFCPLISSISPVTHDVPSISLTSRAVTSLFGSVTSGKIIGRFLWLFSARSLLQTSIQLSICGPCAERVNKKALNLISLGPRHM